MLPTPRRITSKKTLKQPAVVVRNDARPRIPEGHDGRAGAGCQYNLDTTIRPIVFNRVVQHILQGLLEQDGVGRHHHSRNQHRLEVPSRRQSAAFFNHVSENRGEVDGHARPHPATAIRRGQEQQFLNDGFEVMNLPE
jgi:hypothetical protein